MKENKLLRSRRWVRGLQVAAAATVTLGMTGMMGCLNRPIEPLEPRRTSTIVERLTQSSVDKIDLVLGIDNSRSMADKQQILEVAIPDLVNGLVNPRCLDPNGVPSAMQPTGPLESCPIAGHKREFEPVTDIHIGIISSSIGGHGADACPDQENNTCAPSPNFTNNDKGHLVTRGDECGGVDVATYQNKAFLAWDPKQKLTPPGEGNLMNLTTSLAQMVVGTGQIGCGYEAQLESWYRFLVDPEPYEKITAIDGKATPENVDQTLLTQRADFLRPDSLLAIIMLTDENDCSIKEFGQFFFAARIRATAPPIPPATTRTTTSRPSPTPRTRRTCAASTRSAASASTSSTRSTATRRA
jgi:hypothetical protein